MRRKIPARVALPPLRSEREPLFIPGSGGPSDPYQQRAQFFRAMNADMGVQPLWMRKEDAGIIDRHWRSTVQRLAILIPFEDRPREPDSRFLRDARWRLLSSIRHHRMLARALP